MFGAFHISATKMGEVGKYKYKYKCIDKDKDNVGAFHISATRMGEVGKDKDNCKYIDKYKNKEEYKYKKRLAKFIHKKFEIIMWPKLFPFPGTFLLIYFIAMFACGIPIFFQVQCLKVIIRELKTCHIHQPHNHDQHDHGN